MRTRSLLMVLGFIFSTSTFAQFPNLFCSQSVYSTYTYPAALMIISDDVPALLAGKIVGAFNGIGSNGNEYYPNIEITMADIVYNNTDSSTVKIYVDVTDRVREESTILKCVGTMQ